MRVAMAMEVVVNPARAAADRRTPKRPAEDAAYHSPRHGTERTGDDQAGSRACRSTNPVGARAMYVDHQQAEQRRRQSKPLCHHAIPRTRMSYAAQGRPDSWQTSGNAARKSTARSFDDHLAMARPSISSMLLKPVSAMVTLNSLRMISIARATPASPPAPSP